MFIQNITKRNIFKVFILNLILTIGFVVMFEFLQIDLKSRFYFFIVIYMVFSTVINYTVTNHTNLKFENDLFFYGQAKIPNQNFLKFFPKDEYKGKTLLISVEIPNHENIVSAFSEDFYHEIFNNIFNQIKKEIKNRNLITSNNLRKMMIVGDGDNYLDIIEKLSNIFSRRIIINSIPIKLEYFIGFELLDNLKNLHEKTIFDNANIASSYAALHDIKVVNFEQIKNYYTFDYTLLKYFPKALEDKEVTFLYQPIISRVKEDNICVEMLVRWNRQGVSIMPNDFIPYLEKTLLINDLTIYAIKEAAIVIKEFIIKGLKVVMTINVSPRSISSNKFIEDAFKTITASGVAPKHFEFEITEGTLMNFNEQNINNLQKIRDFGIKTTIDDFGSGYSSLAYLNKMVVDYIKIDRGLLVDVVNDHKSAKLFENIVQMLKDLDYGIVCEGVETLDQAKFLKELNIDFYQGYFISRPVKDFDLYKWMDKNYDKYVKKDSNF